MVDGEGRALAIDEVVRRMSAADVALIGEMHGHPRGLALASQLFERVAASSPRAALSLENVERDQQAALDAFVAGAIEEAELARRRGGATLPAEHAAMVATARAHRLVVIAANAPRRHAKQARTEGWDALRALPAEEQAHFTLPQTPPGGGYAARFTAAMGGAASHGGGGHGDPLGADDERVASFYRAQILWDATMADSIARALGAGRAPVVHVVGGFHVEHDGGLVQLLRRARPAARVFTLVVVEAPSDRDRGRADVVAHVGPSPREHP